MTTIIRKKQFGNYFKYMTWTTQISIVENDHFDKYRLPMIHKQYVPSTISF